ncbi:MAG: hypothetical protein DRN53_01375 [Thermoprotei archaeon]|nr:MAG: hypothetical protein DRN53_01375 [Thermoprotei archaeon]
MLVLNRRGGIPPIVTVMTVIAFVAASAIISWWIITTTLYVVKKPILRIVPSPVVMGNTLYITIANDGSVAYSGSVEVILKGSSGEYEGSTTVNIDAGSSSAIEINLSGTPTDGKLEGVLKTSAGTLRFTASVVKG